jgi:hypothetical protein
METKQKPGAANVKRKKPVVCQERKSTDKGVMYCVFDKYHGGGHSWGAK